MSRVIDWKRLEPKIRKDVCHHNFSRFEELYMCRIDSSYTEVVKRACAECTSISAVEFKLSKTLKCSRITAHKVFLAYQHGESNECIYNLLRSEYEK